MEAQQQSIQIFKNIGELLKHGMFPGAHSAFVAQAISFIETIVADAEAKVAAVEDPA